MGSTDHPSLSEAFIVPKPQYLIPSPPCRALAISPAACLPRACPSALSPPPPPSRGGAALLISHHATRRRRRPSHSAMRPLLLVLPMAAAATRTEAATRAARQAPFTPATPELTVTESRDTITIDEPRVSQYGLVAVAARGSW